MLIQAIFLLNSKKMKLRILGEILDCYQLNFYESIFRRLTHKHLKVQDPITDTNRGKKSESWWISNWPSTPYHTKKFWKSFENTDISTGEKSRKPILRDQTFRFLYIHAEDSEELHQFINQSNLSIIYIKGSSKNTKYPICIALAWTYILFSTDNAHCFNEDEICWNKEGSG